MFGLAGNISHGVRISGEPSGVDFFSAVDADTGFPRRHDHRTSKDLFLLILDKFLG
jgi:hypothetical protein